MTISRSIPPPSSGRCARESPTRWRGSAPLTRPAGLLIEGANPRHDHDVEHPELVAQRIVRYADLVGRARVITGTDCGLGTFAGYGPVEPDIAWEKMRSLTRGAALASHRLWPRAAVVAV